MPSELMTWGAIFTLFGASYLTLNIVNISKKYVKLPTDIYAVMVGFAVLIIAQLAIAPELWSDWRTYALAVFNAVVVWLNAGKSNDKAINEQSKK